jgi:ABC-type sugar transport system permease subunit
MRGARAARRREVAAAYALMTPALALVATVLAYPVAWEVWVSLTDFSSRAAGERAFVGLANGLPPFTFFHKVLDDS